MARTSSQEVLAVLGKDFDQNLNASMKPFIRAAYAMVTRVLACAIAKEAPLTSEEAILIETWLAAHFYSMMDRPYQSSSNMSASASFMGKTDKGLDFTPYGQMASRLDPSGCLEALAGAERAVASGFWGGKPPSEQIDYEDRD